MFSGANRPAGLVWSGLCHGLALQGRCVPDHERWRPWPLPLRRTGNRKLEFGSLTCGYVDRSRGSNCMCVVQCSRDSVRRARGERRESSTRDVWESTMEDVSVRGKRLQVSMRLKSRQLSHQLSLPIQLITSQSLRGCSGRARRRRRRSKAQGSILWAHSGLALRARRMTANRCRLSSYPPCVAHFHSQTRSACRTRVRWLYQAALQLALVHIDDRPETRRD
jgi:hypothetical protein